MTGEPVSSKRRIVSETAASNSAWRASAPTLPSARAVIPSIRSLGRGMLPMGSVGSAMSEIYMRIPGRRGACAMSSLPSFRIRPLGLATAVVAAAFAAAHAQSLDPSLYSDLKWRLVGPFRGGWATCAAGVPDDPAVYYFGAAAGGVWKTEDAGSTWRPIFDQAGSASVGAIAIAPPNPRVIWVGTGQIQARYDAASGDGVYRSDDGGASWRRVGLEATRAIGRIVADPRDVNVAVVAALGHLYGPNRERGIFRTEDGGKTWAHVLFVDDATGGADLAADPENP